MREIEREGGVEVRCSGIFPLPGNVEFWEAALGESIVGVVGGGVVFSCTESSGLVVVNMDTVFLRWW